MYAANNINGPPQGMPYSGYNVVGDTYGAAPQQVSSHVSLCF